MAQLSEWLQIMLAEIARKQQESRSAAEEDERRNPALAPTSSAQPAAARAPAPKRSAAR